MRLPARFRLKAFPDDKQLWKIDWFGDLLPNPNAKSEPLLEIFVVPFRGNIINQQTLKQRGSYDYRRFRKIKVGISLLPFLHLGTFWRNGIHQTASLSERVILKDLKIDTDSTRVISAENFTAYQDLTSLFPSIELCPKTNLLEIDFPRNSNQKILIPSYEVIRTYYAGSSPLTRAIITGGIRFRQNTLFDPVQTNLDETTGIGILLLRKKLAKTDRYNVARLAFSKTAMNAVWGIYSSIVKNFNNTNRHIVEATFPFIGETDLQVCGKWFKQGELWHLLVYFIESCSHPFPYKQLIWGIEGEKEVNSNPQSDKKVHLINRTINESKAERDVGSDGEPDLKSVFSEAMFDGQKFTDLENKDNEKRIRIETSESDDHYKVITEKTDETRDLSTGAGTFGTSSKQGVIIIIGEDEEPEQEIKETTTIIPAGWKLFVGILDELEKKPQIKTRIIKFLMDSDSYSKSNIATGIYFPVSLNGKIISWSFLDQIQNHRRQAMLAEILIGEQFFYLFDTEVKTDDVNDRYSMIFIYKNDYTEIEEKSWRILLSDAVRFRGIKRNKWRWDNIKKQKYRHDLKDIEKYAKRILNFVISEISNKQGNGKPDFT